MTRRLTISAVVFLLAVALYYCVQSTIASAAQKTSKSASPAAKTAASPSPQASHSPTDTPASPPPTSPAPSASPSVSPVEGVSPLEPAPVKDPTKLDGLLPNPFASPSARPSVSPPLESPLLKQEKAQEKPPSGVAPAPPIMASTDAPAKAEPKKQSNAYPDYEDTKISVIRGIVFKNDSGVNKTVPVTIPVRYRSGSIYLDDDGVKELLQIQSQIQQVVKAGEELRVAESILTERYNALLARSVPADAIKDDSFSLARTGLGDRGHARDFNKDIPHSNVKIREVKP